MAEGAPLLRAYTLTRIEGSNPSLSAIKTTALKAVFFYLKKMAFPIAVNSIAVCSQAKKSLLKLCLNFSRRLMRYSLLITEQGLLLQD